MRHYEVRPGEARCHPLVHRLHQRGRCSPVVEQIVDLISSLPGLLVGVEISSSEAVDRLLGITHHQQEMVWCREAGLEQAPLQWIRVLKFVDESHAIALPNRG